VCAYNEELDRRDAQLVEQRAIDKVIALRRSHAELLKALKWAMQQIHPYSNRIKGQNERFCDGYDAANEAIRRAEAEKESA
jgi:hypothetical protein